MDYFIDILRLKNRTEVSIFCEKNIEKKIVRVLSESEQSFINQVYNIVEENYPDENFNVEILSREIGISSPHLYRKIMKIADIFPNGFIRDLRMNKALSLIKQKRKNITEIALDVGMNNPSYFAKCFHSKYGILPSKFAI